MDYRYGSSGQNPYLTQTQYEYVNIPFWALSVTRQFTPNLWLQVIWSFDYERNYYYPGGWIWDKGLSPLDNIGFNPAPLTLKLQTDLPSRAVRNHEWYFRLGFNISRWSGHLFYAYYWDKSLTAFRRGFRIVNGLPQYIVEAKPTRMHGIGLALDTNFWFLDRNWAMFFENIFYLNKYLPNLMESPLALGLTNPLLNRYDGVSKRNLYKHVWGVQSYFLRDFSFMLYWAYYQVFGMDGGILAPQPASPKPYINAFFLPAVSYAAPWTEDRLKFTYINMFTAERFTTKQYFETSYSFSNYLSASVAFHVYIGKPSDLAWGQWNDRSFVEFKLKYEF